MSIGRAEREGHTAQCMHPAYEPGEPDGVLAWFEWAGEYAKTHKQERCLHCNRWRIWVPKVSPITKEPSE